MEVLIAVAITAIIGVGIWQVLSGIVKARDRVDDLATQFEALQRTMLFLERDLTQLINRPVRNIYGDYELALSSRENDYALLLTRQGWRNPLGIRRSNLQRVAWEYTGDELRRRYWVSVDQGQEDESRVAEMLQNVKDFRIRFMDEERSWRESWPSDDALSGQGQGSRPDISLPLGIEVVIEHERFGELTRTFPMPQFDKEAAQNTVNQSQTGTESGEAGEPEEGAASG